MPKVRRASKPIPPVGSPRNTYEFNDYSKGMNSFVGTDKFPVENGGANMWRLAQNARITTLGEYETRKGFDFHSAAAGETIDVQQTSTTGAADQDISQTIRIAKKITFTTTGRVSRLDINLKNSASATGTVLAELYTDSSGEPGTLLARSSVDGADIESSYAYEVARVVKAPAVTATDYWVVAYVQATGSGSYKISSTTNASTGLVSTDSGTSWSAANVDFNVKAYLSTTGGVKGFVRTMKADGTKVTLFAHGTVLYSVNESTGALTSVKTGLSASATHYEFCKVNDIVYYVNGFDGLRKWDFTTESQVNASNYNLITEHKGLLMLLDATDNNKVVYSNFAEYETFTSTDFFYVPSPKTGDPVVAMLSLNGYLMLFTKKSKFILSGEDNATFRLDEAPAQKGTYSQRTVATDNNYAYFLSDDGFYRSNGSEDMLMSENIYEDILNLDNRDNAAVVVNRGRAYLWYSSDGSANNDSCRVWNTSYSGKSDTVESLDTDAFVNQGQTATNDEDALVVASSLIGQVYWQELESNDFTNLGGDIDFLLETHHNPFSVPAVLKEIRYWKPRFEAQSEDYSIACEYAYDLRTSWTTQANLSVQGAGETYGGGSEYGDGSVYGTDAETQGSLYVPGEYRRIGLRYKHYATRQPHKFLGHTLVVQTRRIR